jgi:hypothetical protein
MQSKQELLATLRKLLRDVLDARFHGGAYAKLARAHGLADGYMRALLDAGVLDAKELMALVGNERRAFVEDADDQPASSKVA